MIHTISEPEEVTNIHEIMDNLPPTVLAKIAVYVGRLAWPGIEAEEMRALMALDNAAFDAGLRNSGDDFMDVYFDEVIAQR